MSGKIYSFQSKIYPVEGKGGAYTIFHLMLEMHLVKAVPRFMSLLMAIPMMVR